jgi:hypothetical protein
VFRQHLENVDKVLEGHIDIKGFIPLN